MAKLFLTYAWKDNEDRDVEYVVKELREAGLDVTYDKAEFLVGDRLWEQIDKAFKDPAITGWAIYTTEASLRSPACKEELAYALERALDPAGRPFPMIAILPAPVDEDMHRALKVRLWVSLQDPDWKARIVDSLHGRKTVPDLSDIGPVGVRWHRHDDLWIMEVWPRAGRWDPFYVRLPPGEQVEMRIAVRGPKGRWPNPSQVMVTTLRGQDGSRGLSIPGPIDALTSAYVCFDVIPKEVWVGEQHDGFTLRLDGQPLTP